MELEELGFARPFPPNDELQHPDAVVVIGPRADRDDGTPRHHQRYVGWARTARRIYHEYKTAEALFVAVEVAVRRELLKRTVVAVLGIPRRTTKDTTHNYSQQRPALLIEVITLVVEFAVESQLPNHSTPPLATMIKDRGKSQVADASEKQIAAALHSLDSKSVRSIAYTVQKEVSSTWDDEVAWKNQLQKHRKSLYQQLCRGAASSCQETASATRTKVCLSSFDLGGDRRRASILDFLPKVVKGMPQFLPIGSSLPRSAWECQFQTSESLCYVQKKSKAKRKNKKRRHRVQSYHTITLYDGLSA